jgi:ADP-ribosylglycohydrolase
MTSQIKNPLLGQATGDRIGGPIRMALILGNTIADKGGLDTTELTKRYLAWYRTDAFDTGPVWSAVFDQISAGVDPEEAAKSVDHLLGGMTAGANTAHRATAIGCASVIPDALVAAEARREAKLTHWHPDAGEASAATALIIRGMLRGATLSDAISAAAAATTGLVNALLAQPSIEAKYLSKGGYAPKTLEAAIYFTQTSSSFADAIRRSIHFAGAANYCPVLVGAFAALQFGVEPVAGFPIETVLVEPATTTFDRLWKP